MKKLSFLLLLLAVLCHIPCSLQADEGWSVREASNIDSPGKMIAIKHDGRWVARLVYGEGQMKPYLHVYGEDEELLTNGGLDAKGKPIGTFPHHRGLFIGWKIQSDLGQWDLWHMNRGGGIEVVDIEKLEATPKACRLQIRTQWLADPEKVGPDKKPLLLQETRTMTLTRPDNKYTQIDCEFVLTADRDLKLAGDLQHSGIHFRASNEVHNRKDETSYLMDPDQKTKGHDLRWCRLLFPIGNHWYGVQQINAPANPVDELSTRNYGRFGYFFKRDMKKDETLRLRYRFVVERVDPPSTPPQLSPEQASRTRKNCQTRYEQYISAR